MRALDASEATGVDLIVGTEVQLDDGLKLVLLASTQAAYSTLCELITRGRRRSAKGEYALSRSDLGILHEEVLVLWVPVHCTHRKPERSPDGDTHPAVGDAHDPEDATAAGSSNVLAGMAGSRSSFIAVRTMQPNLSVCSDSDAGTTCPWSPAATCTCMRAAGVPCRMP